MSVATRLTRPAWRWGCLLTSARPSEETRPWHLNEIPPDDGCEVAPKCLECPLPQCKYDDPAGYLRHLRHQRDTQILEKIYQEGLTFEEAAKFFGVSTRAIFRASARHRKNLAATGGEGVSKAA